MFGRKGLTAAAGTSPAGELPEASNQLAAQIKVESATCHPLVFAAKMVGFFSPPSTPGAAEHITVEDIDHPTICETQSNGAIAEGLSFKFVGQRGESGVIYMFEGFAAIWPNGETSPRARISIDTIGKYVGNYSGCVRDVTLRIRPQPHRESEQERRIRGRLPDFLDQPSR
ncbi:hypothetical protein [Sphingomonas sp.]|uniref:hypothetical protein n=1 Tax=Sphingomonas sp. TaxID=28214 RepID=UPI003D6CBCEA